MRVPRFAGPATFARLPTRAEVDKVDVAILGIPYDNGVTYRPGARFGPSGIRQASRLLRPYHPGLELMPFEGQQVADCGDVACTPFDIPQALAEIEAGVAEVLAGGARVIALGGDHTIALPMLRAVSKQRGPVALLHFDAHLDTWDSHFGQRYTHGSPFRRAAEEKLFLTDRSLHIGIRGPIFSASDLEADAGLGFRILDCTQVAQNGPAWTVEKIRERVADGPVYISIDIDVLDPAFAPGTGTPEAGGLSSRELLNVLRGLKGIEVASADLVEVAPAYDHAEITGIAAAHLVYELLGLLAAR
jgi:agmatinase